MQPFKAIINESKTLGRPVVGCFPLYPPLELFHSMNMTPVVLWGLRRYVQVIDIADNHLQPYTCSVARYLTELVLSDMKNVLDGVFAYNACDTLRNLPEILDRGLAAEGVTLPFVNAHIPMVAESQTNSSSYFGLEIMRLIELLERTYGRSFSAAKFEESVDLYKRIRELCKDLERLVREGRLSYHDFCAILDNCSFYPPEHQIRMLQQSKEAYMQVEQAMEGLQPRRKTMLSGILPPPSDLIKVIESRFIIAGNDIASQRRFYGYTPQSSTDPASYYLDFYRNHVPCPTLLYTADKRIDNLRGLFKESGATSVIFVAEKYCECEYFEFPYIIKILHDQGIPVITIEVTPSESLASQKTRIEAFAELLEAKT